MESYRRHADGGTYCARASVYQMSGTFRFCRAPCLNRGGAGMPTAPAIDLKFGNCGQATFLIAKEGLAVQNFDRVAAVVESH